MKLREGSLTGVATALLCVRDLAALSVHPLLVHPTHYTGEEGYISDTEDTQVIHTGDTGQLSAAGIVTDIYLLTIGMQTPPRLLQWRYRRRKRSCE